MKDEKDALWMPFLGIMVLGSLFLPFIIAMIYYSSPLDTEYWPHLLIRTILPFGGGWWSFFPAAGIFFAFFGASENRDFRWYAPGVVLSLLTMLIALTIFWIDSVSQMDAGGLNSDNFCALLLPWRMILPALKCYAIGLIPGAIINGTIFLLRLSFRFIKKLFKKN